MTLLHISQTVSLIKSLHSIEFGIKKIIPISAFKRANERHASLLHLAFLGKPRGTVQFFFFFYSFKFRRTKSITQQNKILLCAMSLEGPRRIWIVVDWMQKCIASKSFLLDMELIVRLSFSCSLPQNGKSFESSGKG